MVLALDLAIGALKCLNLVEASLRLAQLGADGPAYLSFLVG